MNHTNKHLLVTSANQVSVTMKASQNFLFEKMLEFRPTKIPVQGSQPKILLLGDFYPSSRNFPIET